MLAHTGPRELDGHPLGGYGSGFGLVPDYTTLSARVRANIQFSVLICFFNLRVFIKELPQLEE